MKKIDINELKKWHYENEHEKIVEVLTKLSSKDMNFELAGLLARAENNLGNYQKALDILLPYEEEGRKDHYWNFRVGYAYYYMDDKEAEALPYFETAHLCNKKDEDTLYMLANLYHWLKVEKPKIKIPKKIAEMAKKDRESANTYDPDLYTEEDMDTVTNHIERYFGKNENVLHEILSPDLHIDVYLIEPTSDRNYYTLVTVGMGAYIMDIPKEYEADNLCRAELMIMLPPDWQVNKTDDDKWYWPIGLLKWLARFPKSNNTWFGNGQTIGNGWDTLSDSCSFTGVLLKIPSGYNEDAWSCRLNNGDNVNFYQVVPIYEDELELKIEKGYNNLVDLFDTDELTVLNVNRKSLANRMIN